MDGSFRNSYFGREDLPMLESVMPDDWMVIDAPTPDDAICYGRKVGDLNTAVAVSTMLALESYAANTINDFEFIPTGHCEDYDDEPEFFVIVKAAVPVSIRILGLLERADELLIE